MPANGLAHQQADPIIYNGPSILRRSDIDCMYYISAELHLKFAHLILLDFRDFLEEFNLIMRII
jgi:hypothetical protein